MNKLDKSFEDLNKTVNEVIDGSPNTTHHAYNIDSRLVSPSNITGMAGVVVFDWDNLCASFTAAGDIEEKNDCIFATFTKPSGAKIGSTADVYIAWQQNDTNGNTGFYYKYKIDKPGVEAGDWSSETHIISDETIELFPRPASGQTIYQMTKLGSFSLSDDNMFSRLCIRLTISTHYSDDDLVYGIILQQDFDQLGSRTPTEK